ncbi:MULTISPECIES: hypothetical protein [unclassified Acidovorax]|uniref:hypothetical protein n=1 Tax=unclassified Acidovorax TaxID=2684926 RepID=UPI000A498D37|nr:MULTISPECIES: hypothetical protein [unclassified Acidovorax]MBD9395034.1 hypothetical protein [Acidovorax sp. ACV01]
MLIRIVCFLAAIGMFGLSWGCYVENKAFRLYGLKAQLAPIDSYIDKTTTFKRKKESPFFDNTPREYKSKGITTYFMTANSERVEVSSGVPAWVVDKMISRQDVVITYVSNNPKLVRYDDHTANTTGAAITGLILLLASFVPWRRS